MILLPAAHAAVNRVPRDMQSEKLSKGRMGLPVVLLACLGLLAPLPGGARAEALFDAAGYRMTEYRAPVPATAPGAETIDIPQVQALAGQGALLLDVMGLKTYQLAPDGQFLTPEHRDSLPGAVWLPVVGWGQLEPWQQDYLDSNLARLTRSDKARPIIVFCKVDCWVSWNVVKRLNAEGYSRLYWFAGGSDAWADAGLPLHRVLPEPVRKAP